MTPDQLQKNYVEELRSLLPEITAWWCNLACVDSLEQPPPLEVRRRWPTLWSGHPKLLAVFRCYFLQIDELNIDAAAQVAAGQLLSEQPFTAKSPIDLLLHDLEQAEPELHRLVEGIVFVPVGLDAGGMSC